MSCTHGRTESTCIYCATEKTHNLVAKQTAIQAAAAAEQSAFIAEQRYKADLRETAESIRTSMRHDYLKFVKDNKNKAVNFGSGPISLDAADVELYWAEYREFQFTNIEINRETLASKVTSLNMQLRELMKKIGSRLKVPNIISSVLSIFILIMAISGSGGKQMIAGFIGFLLGLTASGVATFVKKGMPKEMEDWISAIPTVFPWAVFGYAIVSSHIFGVFLCLILLGVIRQIKPSFIKRDPEYRELANELMRTEKELSDLPSQELLNAIRRLN